MSRNKPLGPALRPVPEWFPQQPPKEQRPKGCENYYYYLLVADFLALNFVDSGLCQKFASSFFFGETS
jgi:hypothetical protein